MYHLLGGHYSSFNATLGVFLCSWHYWPKIPLENLLFWSIIFTG